MPPSIGDIKVTSKEFRLTRGSVRSFGAPTPPCLNLNKTNNDHKSLPTSHINAAIHQTVMTHEDSSGVGRSVGY